ncbi:hypothetical protein BASA81_003363 [Batrachochytrium salamandrivorans]|nr:hypothetical protein BASA81_003363 [Batrachochytrium salamandrivorans]
MSFLSSADAERIGQRAIQVARKNNLAPMAVCVLNAAGQTLYFKMEDGNPLFREQIARGKATGALGLGTDTANMPKMFDARPHFFQALFASTQGNVIPVAGGIVVRDPKTGAVLGSVGMSGDVSEKDEWCCVEGVKSVGLQCQALKENREAFLKAHL